MFQNSSGIADFLLNTPPRQHEPQQSWRKNWDFLTHLWRKKENPLKSNVVVNQDFAIGFLHLK